MGCDIHFYIETRPDKKADWTLETFHDMSEDQDNPEFIDVSDTHLDRDYSMFALMAGVRGEGPEPKGIPHNMSKDLQNEYVRWDADGHSHSWMTVDELKDAIDQYFDGKPWFDTDYTRVYEKASKWLIDEMAEAQLLSSGLEPQVRFVFWFDN